METKDNKSNNAEVVNLATFKKSLFFFITKTIIQLKKRYNFIIKDNSIQFQFLVFHTSSKQVIKLSLNESRGTKALNIEIIKKI